MIEVTQQAIHHLKTLISDNYAIKIGIETKGCSGLAYTMVFAETKEPFDEEVCIEGVRLLIDPKAQMFIIGTVIDFESTPFSEGFIFNNPNEKGKCGCGKSFHV